MGPQGPPGEAGKAGETGTVVVQWTVEEIKVRIKLLEQEKVLRAEAYEYAKLRFEQQWVAFFAGTITLDRLTDAIERCRIARELIAVTLGEKIVAAEDHRERLALLLKSLEEGRGNLRFSEADKSEVRHCHKIAELSVVQLRIRGTSVLDVAKHEMSKVHSEIAYLYKTLKDKISKP